MEIEPWLTIALTNKDAYLLESRELDVSVLQPNESGRVFPSLVSCFSSSNIMNETPVSLGSRPRPKRGRNTEPDTLKGQTPLVTIDLNRDVRSIKHDTLPITANCQLNSQAHNGVWHGFLGRCHLLTWYEEHWSMAELVDRVYSNLIFRFSDVALFYSHGRQESIEHTTTLLRWLRRSPNTLEEEHQPSVVIIFTDLLHDKCKEFTDRRSLISDMIRTYFPLLHVSMTCLPRVDLCAQELMRRPKQSLQLLISQLSNGAQDARVRSSTRFKLQDFTFLFGAACEHFAKTPSKGFDFVLGSRLTRPVPLALESHVSELLRLLLRSGTLETASFTPSILASALMLDAFPPGHHQFGSNLFSSLYRGKLISAFNDAFPQDMTSTSPHDSNYLERLLSATEQTFLDNHTQMENRNIEAAVLHRENLLRSASEWKTLHCMTSCLSCLSNTSEHVLHGGHTLCSRCIMLLGEGDVQLPYQRILTHCPFCGYTLESTRQIVIRPPTAGIRVLTFDGGGVRGILELELLKILEERLQFPVIKAFDLMVGTSTGGLIALGLGVNRWSIKQCQDHFENLLVKAFHHRQASKVPLIGRLIGFALSYLTDSLYDTTYFETALSTAFGEDEPLFGKGTDDGLKTAAVATTVDSFPCVLSNYNGPRDRAKNRGYLNLRGNIMVNEAARSTSAAPFYHRSTRISCATSTGGAKIGPLNLQDGGTCGMNNPVTIAIREAQFLNPSSGHQDLLISVGSYQLETENIFCDGEAPPGWITRMGKAFLRTFDCQRAWNENISHLQEAHPDHYHRLAVGFRKELPFDDIQTVKDLKYAARSGFEGSEQLSSIARSIEAKCFYFELASTPAYHLNYRCQGYIYCRLRAGSPELHKLVNRLAEGDAQFTLDNRSIATIDHEVLMRVAMGCPFTLECNFLVSSLDQPISIMLGGAERHAVSISTFPETISWFIHTQGLNHGLGKGFEAEKRLPELSHPASKELSKGRKRIKL